jgi:hypothetical protein
MSWDILWQIRRYLLIAGGGFLVGKDYISAENGLSRTAYCDPLLRLIKLAALRKVVTS